MIRSIQHSLPHSNKPLPASNIFKKTSNFYSDSKFIPCEQNFGTFRKITRLSAALI